jgi:hypothetical protein
MAKSRALLGVNCCVKTQLCKRKRLFARTCAGNAGWPQYSPETKRASVRERDLPAHVVVHYVIALALSMRSSTREVSRCLLEGVQWLLDPSVQVKVAGKSGISQARSRLGAEPLRRLYAGLVGPIAEKRTQGAWYRQWRIVSLDGSSLDVADTQENKKAFGRPSASRGETAFPRLRFVALLENGTHVLWAARMGPFATDEITLARDVVAELFGLSSRGWPAMSLFPPRHSKALHEAILDERVVSSRNRINSRGVKRKMSKTTCGRAGSSIHFQSSLPQEAAYSQDCNCCDIVPSRCNMHQIDSRLGVHVAPA